MTLLLVEDEERITAFVTIGLEAHGYTVEHAATGADALARLAGYTPDLILLDLALPDMDGLEILRLLRADDRPTPVIVLTARAHLDDVVEGLDCGAEDYMTKPFAFDELLARVHARLRRIPNGVPSVLTAGTISLDRNTRQATSDGRTVALSPREFDLAETFLRHPDEVLSREQLLAEAWGAGAAQPGSNVVDVYVLSLRAKLGHDRIETIRGAGYRLLPA